MLDSVQDESEKCAAATTWMNINITETYMVFSQKLHTDVFSMSLQLQYKRAKNMWSWTI